MKKIKYYLELVNNFTKRDLKVRYSSSILGFLWIFFYPISMTVIASLVFSIVFKSTIEKVPYFLFAMIGLISWNFFMQTVLVSTRTLVWNRELIDNTNFPKDALIIATSFSKTVDFGLNMAVFLVAFFLSQHQSLPPKVLLIFLTITTAQFLFQTGISFLTSSLNIYFRDVQNGIDIFLQVLFYLTPVVYPITLIPQKFSFIFSLNPLTQIIEMYREIFFKQVINWQKLIFIWLISASFFIIGYKVFKRLEKNFADVI
ncbi:hypothetical protein COU95_00405 [Candidatus Shapirobacteria bacterium CG10_big_fil_rev_8_21_14_0_10_40_9]|uniref:Transport permease protein n=1 Tax=Candidatus Shapirobacteria bacterium CG10_big_fil_rev_8_21_14_0_10_40_9 TaxID=1974888 RepID=A0A2M8L4D0_9BACT|nr:MAG: hypothetical protein COU95_00405 [Candidatus Shapirobacteria bacterium CG10_big_fil_rev_8_21_14_0_10_40_9]